MATIIGISGSLRTDSLNTKLLKAATQVPLEGIEIQIESIADIPLYNGDVEARGIPDAVTHLKNRIAASAGVLLATPEYNNAMPGVLKNAIDWLSRPSEDIARVFHGRAIAIMGASPGPYGTQLAQNAWLPVVRTLRMRPWFDGRLMVPRASSVFAADDAIVDAKIKAYLEEFVRGFATFASRHAPD